MTIFASERIIVIMSQVRTGCRRRGSRTFFFFLTLFLFDVSTLRVPFIALFLLLRKHMVYVCVFSMSQCRAAERVMIGVP